MATEVILPKVDMDMATGTISKWLVKDGDTVKKGQVLFEIETDKAAMEIDSPADGVIRLSGETGKALAIGTVVGMIYAAGESAKAFEGAAAAAVAAPAETAKPSHSLAVTPPETRPDDGVGVRATPLARRLAKQAGIALSSLTGSGPRGRITSADVRIPAPAPATADAPALASSTTPDSAAVRALYAEGSYEVKPLDGMRRTIAQRLTHSKQTVPHFYLSATCNIDLLLEMRERMNASAPRDKDKNPAWKLSINDFVIKALALALQQVPAANVSFAGDAILAHKSSDVGVAVSVEGGLFTPIIRNAERKTLSEISTEMKDLAARARARRLQPHEYQGGSAAVSNLGMYGVESFTAIINPPQACILAVGAAVERFVPVNKQPVLATQMSVTLSVDHRAVDGAVGAQLLQAFKSLIEDPALMLL